MRAVCRHCGHVQSAPASVPRGESDYCDQCGAIVRIGRDYLAMTIGALLSTFLSIVVIVIAVYFGKTIAKRAGLT